MFSDPGVASIQGSDAFLRGYMDKRLGHALAGPEIAAYVGIPGGGGRRGNQPTMMDVPGAGKTEYVKAFGVFDPQPGDASADSYSFGPPRSEMGRQEAIPAHPSFNRSKTAERYPGLLTDRYGKPIPEGFMPGLRTGVNHEPYKPAATPPVPQASRPVPSDLGGPSSPPSTPRKTGNPFGSDPPEFQDLMRRLGVLK